MAIKKITRKVITPAKKEIQPQPAGEEALLKEGKPKKGCLFCQKDLNPSYTDLATLQRFLTDRAKIVGRERSGVCAKHQRAVAKNIKYARHLALLPFVPKV